MRADRKKNKRLGIEQRRPGISSDNTVDIKPFTLLIITNGVSCVGTKVAINYEAGVDLRIKKPLQTLNVCAFGSV